MSSMFNHNIIWASVLRGAQFGEMGGNCVEKCLNLLNLTTTASDLWTLLLKIQNV